MSERVGALRAGQPVELTIEKAVYRGLGLARHAGEVVFVRGAFDGERVNARIVSAARGYAEAVVESTLVASPHRREAPCRHAAACGGCAYQYLAYDEQLRLKERVLRESLARARVVWDAPIPVTPSPETGWRMRAEMHFAASADGLALGFHEEGSHRVVDVVECLQISPKLQKTALALRSALASLPIEKRKLRSLELAESPDGAQRVACLHTELPVGEVSKLASLAEAAADLTGLLISAQGPNGPLLVTAHGEPYLRAQSQAIDYRMHQQSFFQANRFLYQRLVKDVLARIAPGDPVLDVYSGVGLFALALAVRGDRVRGVEANPLSVDDARANASAAGLTVEFEIADADRALAAMPKRRGERVVLDPPRTGMSRVGLRALVERRPATITYVSCDPPTLGRDLARLLEAGYRLRSLEALDMFPDTFHLESVAHLDREAVTPAV